MLARVSLGAVIAEKFVTKCAATLGLLLSQALVLLHAQPAHAQRWMHWPTDRATTARFHLSQGFYGNYIGYCGARDGCGTHNGYDYAIPVGTSLYAVAPGVVDAVHPTDTRSADYGGAGLWVRVRHEAAQVPGLPRTYYVTYMHLSRIEVTPGQMVNPQVRIGLSGNTGNVGAHLHLHVATVTNYCGGAVDPGCPTPAYVSGSVMPSSFVDAPGCQSICRPVANMWVQPGAYGNEPYVTGAPCVDLDYRGRCEGEVLRWCMNNNAMTANCADRNAVCAFQDPMEGFNCLRCDPAQMRPLLGGPRCEGNRWLRCEGINARSTDCAAMGMECTPEGCRSPAPPMIDDRPTQDAVAAGTDSSLDGAFDSSLSVGRDGSASVMDAGDVSLPMGECRCTVVGRGTAQNRSHDRWYFAIATGAALFVRSARKRRRKSL